MSKLFLMMGAPGSGKSTWVKRQLKDGDAYISRDEIRYQLVKEDEEYFSHENEVFKIFITRINEALLTHKRVFADATHLNLSSRAKVLTRLITEPDTIDSINVIWLKTPLMEVYRRNDLRTGREKVPHNVIKSMYDSIQEPSIKEGISKVYIVDGFTHELKVLSLGQKNKENFIY